MEDDPSLSPNQKRPFIALAACMILLILGSIYFIFHRKHSNAVDPAFSKYIESYTAGIISKENTIRIRLAGQVPTTHVQNDQLPDGVFDFSPSIKGKAYWIDERTIEFRPENKLIADQNYTAEFKLEKIIEVPDQYKNFKFNFQTVKPDFTVSFVGLQTATSTSLDKMKLDGVVQTADDEDDSAIEKLINTTYPSPVHISWQHNNATHTHKFTVTELIRVADKVNPLSVTWDGSSLNVDKKGNQDFEIPAIGDFKVLNITAVQDQDQYVLVQFSDAIMVGQELKGLSV